MAEVHFHVTKSIAHSADLVWSKLIDWQSHSHWVPATRVHVDGDGHTGTGATLTAWTGFGRASLEDRMEVTHCRWDAAATTGECEVKKLGPLLTGVASFIVTASGAGAVVRWQEDIHVPWLPRLLAPLAAAFGAAFFRLALRRLDRHLTISPAA